MYELIRIFLFSITVAIPSEGDLAHGDNLNREEGISAINSGAHFQLELRDLANNTLGMHQTFALVENMYPANSMQVTIFDGTGNNEVEFQSTEGISYSPDAVSTIF